MGMRKSSIYMPESLWELVEGEAAREGIPAAQFIRDSILLRIGYRYGQRGEGRDVIELFERIRDDS